MRIGDVILVKPKHWGKREPPVAMRVKGFDGDLVVVAFGGHTYRAGASEIVGESEVRP